MTKLISTTAACFVLCLSATFASTAQAADSFSYSKMSAAELWFLVDTGQMDEAEALFLLDTRRQDNNRSMTVKSKQPFSTKAVSGLDLGSGRIKSVSDLDLGSGR